VADVTDVVRAYAQPLADDAGLDLLDVQVKGSGSRTLVKVTVDRKGGVGLAECQQLSRDLSRRLDDADPIDSRYQLEVSSPGVTHPLRTQRDFDRVEGKLVVVHRRDGGAVDEVRGTVIHAAESEVVLDADGDRISIAYDDVHTATQALPW
jgi:ribosome maturation factor RimP